MSDETAELTEMGVPDIAFWFDEKDSCVYLLRISENIQYVQLLLAAGDLLGKALATGENITIGEWKKEK